MKIRSREALRAAGIAISLSVLLAGRPLRAQETKEKVTVDDVERDFTVRLPRGYEAQRHYPVVVLLHGMNQDADDMERLTRFSELADKDGIITVYPSAQHGRWNVGVHQEERRSAMMGPGRHGRYGGYPGGGGGYPGGYPRGGGGYPRGGGQQTPESQPERRAAPVDDIAFFNEMLDHLGSKFSVDASRVYVVGLSEGGLMSFKAGCSLSDRITAVAAVGADMPKTMICLPSRPVSVLMINGTSDKVEPYNGGTEHNLNVVVLSAEDSAKDWSKIDRCNDKPEKSKLSAREKGGMETRVDTYKSCQQDAGVVLYSVKGAGNTWPGGEQYEPENTVGKTSSDLNANEVVWNFFVTRKLPQAKAEATSAQ